MVATRGRTFKRPWRRSCLSSKLKSSSAPIGRKDSWCFHAVGSSNAPLLGSTAAEGLPRIGRTSIATRWRSCGLPQSASCSENFVIPPDVFGQTLSNETVLWNKAINPGVDRLAINPNGQLLYVPTGEEGSANYINVVDANTGDIARRVYFSNRSHDTLYPLSGPIFQETKATDGSGHYLYL